MPRLQKIIAASGLTSRRKAEVLISKGHVTVNGKRAQIGDSADPIRDEIMVQGQPIRQPKEFVYYALNKPPRYISSASDEKGRATILDLVPNKPRVFPVGRLDRDSQGLIILTNDGEIANKIAHPKNNITKTYEVELEKPFSQSCFERIKRGIRLDGKKIIPDDIKQPHKSQIVITLHSGQYRVVRRMMETVGHKVIKLTRTHIGKLSLGRTKQGEYRELKPKDLKRITS